MPGSGFIFHYLIRLLNAIRLRQKRCPPGKVALVISASSYRQQSLERLKYILGIRSLPDENIYILAIAGGEGKLQTGMDASGSFFHLPGDVLFDLLYLDDRVKIFNTNYGRSFILKLTELLDSSAQLYLPDWGYQKSGLGFTRGIIESTIGLKGRRVMFGRYLEFIKDNETSIQPPQSILNWYLSNHKDLVNAEISYRSGNYNMDDFINDPVHQGFLLNYRTLKEHAHDRVKINNNTDNQDQLKREIIAAHDYLVSGVAYKMALVEFIIRNLMPGASGLRYLDIGGGFGGLTAELLLACPKLVSYGVTHDISILNLIHSHHLYRYFYPQLNERFKFYLGAVEDFDFPGEYDVISFIGSLLYIRKDDLEETVNKAWLKIRPGGLLIVHENIKAPSYTRDYAVMFESEKLNNLLGKYGKVRFFSSFEYSELPADRVGNKTVFRVLKKN